MNLFLFGFSCAIISAICWPTLLPPLSLPIIAGALLLCVWWHRQRGLHALVIGLAGTLVGVMWITVYSQLLLPTSVVAQQTQGRGHTTPLTVRAEIISLVSVNGDWISLDVQQLRNNDNLSAKNSPATNSLIKRLPKWRLGWDLTKTPQINQLPQQGEVWQFDIKPKAFASILNQGGFNQQRYLLSQHIVRKGKVEAAQRINVATSWRARLLQQLAAQLASQPQRDILQALTMGERSGISRERWQQLRNSGTAHLVAISGLHLSVISLYLFALVNRLLNRFLPCESRRNLLLAHTAALIGAVIYAWLAGFGIPVQRALLMLVVIVLSMWQMRFASPWERLLWALAAVLLLDPFAPLSHGLWLSFVALALILFSWRSQDVLPNVPKNNVAESTADSPADAPRLAELKRWLSNLWRIQWRLCLGMSVLQGLLFGGISLHSFWINLLLVPWFSVLVIPLTMLVFVLAMLLSSIGLTAVTSYLWQLCDWALWPAVKLWQLSTQLAGAWLPVSAPLLFAVALALVSLLTGVYFLRGRRRYWLLLPCVPLLLQLALKTELVMPNRWQIHVLDVGQGLAVVIQQGNHGLLYDTGASFDNFSYAERAILPLLNQVGIDTLDYLIVSHGDNDHAGGAAVILAAFPSAKLISDLPQLTPHVWQTIKGNADVIAMDNCRPHQFNWRQLTLSILAPQQPSGGNNGSCVVQVTDGRFSALLPGDIELPAEIMLTKRYRDLRSDLLIAPHHGSSTSSTQDLLAAVSPRWAIFAAGYHNRWGFPKAEVVERYQQRGIQTFTTGETGQISFDIGADTGKNGATVRTYRHQMAPYWYNRLIAFGNPVNPE